MTYTETQLEAFRVFGDKTLSDGCYIQFVGSPRACKYRGEADDLLLKGNPNFKILGHEPHLEDLFRVAEENGLSFTYYGGRVLNHIIFHIDDDTDIKIPLDAIPLLDQPHLSEIVNLFSK